MIEASHLTEGQRNKVWIENISSGEVDLGANS